MDYKAIITDLDGTAVDSPTQKTATKRLQEAVAGLQRMGLKVCAATGRPQSFAMPVISSMGLKDLCIISGGTRIIDPLNQQEVWSCSINPDDMHLATDKLKKYSYRYLWNDYVETDYLEGCWGLEDFSEYNNTYFFEVCYVPHSEVSEICADLEQIPGLAVTVVVAQRPGYNDLHITNKKATKEHAIYELEKLINVPKEQMIGFGDGHNDLHLYNAVGHKVAMGNAVSELKSKADEVIGNVDVDGLAEYFEKLAKIKEAGK